MSQHAVVCCRAPVVRVPRLLQVVDALHGIKPDLLSGGRVGGLPDLSVGDGYKIRVKTKKDLKDILNNYLRPELLLMACPALPAILPPPSLGKCQGIYKTLIPVMSRRPQLRFRARDDIIQLVMACIHLMKKSH